LKVVFIGDIVGGSGRRTIAAVLPTIREEHAPDLVIANVENAAGGFGINRTSLDELIAARVDFFTAGNHVWDKKEGVELLSQFENIVRPGNYPGGAPGVGGRTVPGTQERVAVVNVQGRVFMPAIDCPFRWIDGFLCGLDRRTKIVIVDVHGEATSEKIAMGWYLDGRVSLVVGTHTHVPTRDCRVLPRGTGYVTDVGMTGSYDGVLGVKKEAVLERFLSMRPTRFEVAGTDLRCDYVMAEIDDETGRTTAMKHLQATVEK